MEEIKIANEAAMRKASILSERYTQEKRQSSLKGIQIPIAPKDPYKLVHLIFFFFGFGTMLPVSFFLTAQQYWMYKLRDPSSEVVDLQHKTELQANFVAYSAISHSVPSVITTILATRYGHKIDIRKRLLTTLTIVFTAFVVFTAFIKINTDSWQLIFFILSMLVSAVITACCTVLMVTQLSLLARFPPKYIKIHMYGSATSGLFSASLQILCLYIGKSATSTALIYFLGGTGVILVTGIFAFYSKYSERFVHYLGDTEADTQKKTQTLAEMWDTAKKLWPNVILMIVGAFLSGIGHPNITTLIVSENYNQGHAWNDVYFTPVITFFWTDVVNILGRMCGRPILTPKTAPWYLAVDLGRIAILSPLYLFCNARTSHERHLPVLFNHDWQYILIHTISVFVAHFFGTCSFLSVKNMIPDNPEQGFMMIQFVSGVFSVISSPLSTMWVHML